MEEREGHWLALIAALALPALCGITLARLMVGPPGAPPRVSTEVVFVMAIPPPVAVVRERDASSSVAARAGSRCGDARPDASSAAASTGPAGDGAPAGGTASGTGGLDLSLPEADLRFGTTTSPASGDWEPSLPRMRVRMVDSSFGGRLARMQKGALCNELKLMASGMPGGSAPDRESLMRELAELGCLK